MSSNWKHLQKRMASMAANVGDAKVRKKNGGVSKPKSPHPRAAVPAEQTKSSRSSKTAITASPSLSTTASTAESVSEDNVDIPPPRLEAQMQEYRLNPRRLLAATLLNDDKRLLQISTVKATSDSLTYPAHKQKLGTFLALDCEFVGCGWKGSQSELARVSIVNYYGFKVFDTFVRPQHKVTDWRTRWSGVTPASVRDAPTFEEAQRRVAELTANRVLVGHSLQNDLKVLMLGHPKHSLVDTQQLARFRSDAALKGRPGLKRLCQYYLGLEIQGGSHDSIEDAQASMLLFRIFRDEYIQEKKGLHKAKKS